jgi:hypothetical protein
MSWEKHQLYYSHLETPYHVVLLKYLPSLELQSVTEAISFPGATRSRFVD